MNAVPDGKGLVMKQLELEHNNLNLLVSCNLTNS